MGAITEKQESRSLSHSAESASHTRVYNLIDYQDAQEALVALNNFIPPTVIVGNFLCILPEFDVSPDFSDPDRTLHTGTVTWNTADQADGGSGSEDDPKEPEDNTSFSFSFSAMSDMKLRSPANSTPRLVIGDKVTSTDDYEINRQHPELPPEGVEFNKAIVTISAKTVIHSNTASNEWFKDRLNQVWTLNNSSWRSLPAKSVAFTGLEGSRRKDGHWDVTYSFEYRPDNAGEDIKNGDQTFKVPATSGWQYIWAEYSKLDQTTDEEDNQPIVKRNIKKIHINDIYETSDFYALGMVGV